MTALLLLLGAVAVCAGVVLLFGWAAVLLPVGGVLLLLGYVRDRNRRGRPSA